MSSPKNKSNRTYVLNVARQFLQKLKNPFNPLTNENRFHELCHTTGHDTRCFYANLSTEAENFLQSFQGPALQRIICASISGEQLGYTFPVDKPVQVPLWLMGANTACLFATNGIGILRNIAAVTLVAAAFDLCYMKHHQPGMAPV